MRKDKLLITISDTTQSRSFSLNKIIRKIILWSILGVIVLLTISFFAISTLVKSVHNLSEDRDTLSAENSLYSKQINMKMSQIKELGTQLEEIEGIIGIEKEADTSLIQRATLAKLTSSVKIFMLQTIPSECPLAECVPTSKFGWRIHPTLKTKRHHNGLDLRAARRTDVKATADGVVRYIQNKNEGALGRVIIISHNYGFETRYAHLRFVDVKVGEVVSKNQIIGKTGNSGRSNGPHLHYEVRYAEKILDPIYFTQWNMKNYEEIFEKQRRVEWESLVNLIKNQQSKLVQQ